MSEAISNGAHLEIKARYSHLEFGGEQEIYMYACLGKYMSDIAHLEYDLDDFIIQFCTKFPKISKAISKSFPEKIRDKIAFFVYASIMYPKLRECGDLDGRMDLHFLYYGMIELFDIRNVIIHGSHIFSETKKGGFVLNVRKSKNLRGGKVAIQQFSYGHGYLEQALVDTHYFQTFIWRAMKVLQGTQDLKKQRDELLRGRANWRELRLRFPELGV
jgi:hypothetical protein